MIYHFDSPLLFANANNIRDASCRLTRTTADVPWILVAAEPIVDIDTTAADMLEDLDKALNAGGTSMVFTEMTTSVFRKVERYELTDTVDPEHFYDTIGEAVQAEQAHTGTQWKPTS